MRTRTKSGVLTTVRVAVLAAAILAGACIASGAATGAKEVVRATTDAVIAVLGHDDLSSAEKRQQIDAIVEARFDFKTLSRLVLARNWKKLDAAQQQAFVQEFRHHLSITYGRNVDSYRDERVVITGEREEVRGDRTVKTIIDRNSAEDVLVDYRMRQKDGEWKVIDVVIEGVSLVANFRSQFRSVISRHGPAKLIELLRQKNEKGETLDEPSS